jgi:hypothetical protein
VNDALSKRFGITYAQGACASRFNLAVWIALDAAPKDVVFPSGVKANDRPHSMIVGHDRHRRSPDHVENGEIGRMIKLLKLRTLRFAQSPENLGGI